MSLSQQEYFGVGSLQHLEKALALVSGKRVFLVTGKHSYALCGAEPLVNKLLSDKIVERFYEIDPNPKMDDILKGIDVFRAFKPDLVIAIGGGSVMDVAKAITILAHQAHDPRAYVLGSEALAPTSTPLIAIPTTSGAGSESTHFAVVYLDNVKYSLADASMLPRVAIVDPTLTLSLTPRVTAYTGADALCQAVESYWSIHSTDESKTYAQRAILLAHETLRAAVQAPTLETRTRMSEAAHCAGKAINISKTTASHALSYPFTSHFGVPHGQAAVLTLAPVFLYNSAVQTDNLHDPRGLAYVQQTMQELNGLLQATSAEGAAQTIQTLLQDIGLEQRLDRLGVTLADLDLVLDEASPQRMGNNPRTVTRADARTLLESTFSS